MNQVQWGQLERVQQLCKKTDQNIHAAKAAGGCGAYGLDHDHC